MGMHTGDAARTAEGYVGMDVHRAARIAAAGHGGQVLVSGTRRRSSTLELLDLGEHRLKDFERAGLGSTSSAMSAFPPLRTISNTNLPRPASSFVGREKELARDGRAASRTGRVSLTLTGPGGSGKTRLAIEAAAELVPDFKAGVFWVGLAPLRDPALVTAGDRADRSAPRTGSPSTSASASCCSCSTTSSRSSRRRPSSRRSSSAART